MPRGDRIGPTGLGPGTGHGKGRKGEMGMNSPFQKSTLGGTLIALASMFIGNWLDEKLAKKQTKNQSEENASNQ